MSHWMWRNGKKINTVEANNATYPILLCDVKKKLFVLRVISLSLLRTKKTHTGAGLTSLDAGGTEQVSSMHLAKCSCLGRSHIFLGPGQHMSLTA